MQRKRGGTNWLGIIVFLVIVIGPTLSSFLARVIGQATGVTVSSNIILGGLIVGAILISGAGSLLRSLGRFRESGETRLPTTTIPPPDMRAPPRPAPPPTSISRAGNPPAKLPGSPKFEPIIDPRILTLGIVGLILFGGVFVVILALSGGI